MIYFLLGVIVGVLIAALNVVLYQKKTQETINKIMKKNQMAESVNLYDELRDISL